MSTPFVYFYELFCFFFLFCSSLSIFNIILSFFDIFLLTNEFSCIILSARRRLIWNIARYLVY